MSGRVHAARGVDGRGDTEGDFAGIRDAILKSRRGEQRTQAWIANVVEPVETVLHDDAIFTDQRNDIGDGGNCDQLQEGFENAMKFFAAPFGARQKSVGEFESNARAAEVRVQKTTNNTKQKDDDDSKKQIGFG